MTYLKITSYRFWGSFGARISKFINVMSESLPTGWIRNEKLEALSPVKKESRHLYCFSKNIESGRYDVWLTNLSMFSIYSPHVLRFDSSEVNIDISSNEAVAVLAELLEIMRNVKSKYVDIIFESASINNLANERNQLLNISLAAALGGMGFTLILPPSFLVTILGIVGLVYSVGQRGGLRRIYADSKKRTEGIWPFDVPSYK